MSASTERAARRDLRRAVGEDAVAIIEAQSGMLVEQREAIDKLVVVVDAHESRLAVLNEEQARVTSQAYHAQSDVQHLQLRLMKPGVLTYDIQTDTWNSPLAARFSAFERMTFCQRLRWLARGR